MVLQLQHYLAQHVLLYTITPSRVDKQAICCFRVTLES